jgi:hypothetical protein
LIEDNLNLGRIGGGSNEVIADIIDGMFNFGLGLSQYTTLLIFSPPAESPE